MIVVSSTVTGWFVFHAHHSDWLLIQIKSRDSWWLSHDSDDTWYLHFSCTLALSSTNLHNSCHHKREKCQTCQIFPWIKTQKQTVWSLVLCMEGIGKATKFCELLSLLNSIIKRKSVREIPWSQYFKHRDKYISYISRVFERISFHISQKDTQNRICNSAWYPSDESWIPILIFSIPQYI